MAYISAASLKTYLDISGAGDDTLLTNLITRAQAMIDAYCNRTFEAAANTSRTFDAVADVDVDGRRLFLDADLASINSIVNGDGTTVTAAQYTTEPRNRTPYYSIRLLGSVSIAWEYNSTTNDPENAITVSGKWAYSTTAPGDIVQACERLAAYLYRQRDNSSDLDRPLFVNNATVLPTTLPSDVRLMLAPYRRGHPL